MTEKMTNQPPDAIYLQWYGELYYDGEIDPDAGGNEVTWCADEINRVDIKYLLATSEREVADEVCAALKDARAAFEDLSPEPDDLGVDPQDEHSYLFQLLDKIDAALTLVDKEKE